MCTSGRVQQSPHDGGRLFIFSDVNVSHHIVSITSKHSRLILLPTIEHLLQLSIIIAVHPLVYLGGCIVVQSEKLLDGGDGLGAVEHWSFASVPLS